MGATPSLLQQEFMGLLLTLVLCHEFLAQLGSLHRAAMDNWGSWDHLVLSHSFIRWPNSSFGKKNQPLDLPLGEGSHPVPISYVKWGGETKSRGLQSYSLQSLCAELIKPEKEVECYGECLANSLSLEPLAFSSLPLP